MQTRLRRAAAFAAVGSLALTAPFLGRLAAVPFAVVAVAALAVTDDRERVFETLARPGDYGVGRLHGLASFAFAATGLAILTVAVDLPVSVFVATVLLVAYGNLADAAVRTVRSEEVWAVTGFAVAGFGAALGGQIAVQSAAGTIAVVPTMAFLAATGAVLAALLRAVFVGFDDPLVMLSVALVLWLFADLTVDVTAAGVALALAVTMAFGVVSYALDTASIPGMLTGVLLGLLTIVLGGYGWFAILLAFFAVGGLSTKFGYDRKLERGVAEARGGARGSGNVLGNSLAALVAVVCFAASPRLPVGAVAFQFAFAGSVATALGDTLSSEVGGLYDAPRLVTTLEPVPPGTDGAVTWQGEVAGVVGAALIGLLAVLAFDIGPQGGAVVVLAGVAGMTADSLLGATVEGNAVGNQAVNFLATLTGAVVGGLLAAAVLPVP